jgi:hypothetical protein
LPQQTYSMLDLRWEMACACPDKLWFVSSRCRKSKIPGDECLDFKPDIYRSPCWPSAPVGDHFVLRIKRRTGLLKKNWYIQRSCYYAISVASKMRKSCSSLLFLVTFQSAVSTSVFNHGAFQIRLIAINHHRRMPCPAAVHVSSAYWPVSCLSPAVRSSV